MFSDENKSSSLAKFLNNFDYVIVDTCSLMEDGFPYFMDALVNAKTYLKEDRHIVIYNECWEELKKHSKNRKDDAVRIAAKRAIKIVRKVRWKRIFEFPKKEKNPNFADNIIYVNVSQRRITQKILVITQDRGLAEDLRKLNLLDSQMGRKLQVCKIMNNGTLEPNTGRWQKHNIHRDFDASNAQRHERPLFAKAKKVDYEETINKVIQGDKRLWANIHNPNYPLDRKTSDINQQLSLLSQLPEDKKKTLKLQLNETGLKEELTAAPKEVKEEKAPETPVKVEKPIDAPLKEKAPKEEKQAPVPSEKAKPEPSFYGDGLTLEAAIMDLGSRYGQLFRDPSVPYFPAVHGPLNLTTDDLRQIALGLKGQPDSYIYNGMNFWSKPAGRGYHVWFKKLEVKPEVPAPFKAKEEKPVVEAKVEEKKSEEAAKPAPKKAKAKKEKAKTEEKPAKKVAKKEAAPKEEAAKPVATLVVAVPDDKQEREQIERRARRTSEKKTVLKAAEKPAKKAKAEETKKETKAKAKKEAAPKEKKAKAKKAENKAPATKVEAKKAPKAEKKEAPKAKPSDSDKDLEAAQKAEARLQSVLSNGNYPKESKIADLKAQIALVNKLKPEDAAKLKYNVATLKMMASMLN